MFGSKDRIVTVVKGQILKGSPGLAYVYMDAKTGIEYLYISNSDGGGLTPLLNRDGTPLVNEDYLNEWG